MERMKCGHPLTDIVSSDEGTSYCRGCYEDALRRDLRRAEAALARVEQVLGPKPPDCGCEGCQHEMQEALEAVRAYREGGGDLKDAEDWYTLRRRVRELRRMVDSLITAKSDLLDLVGELRYWVRAPEHPGHCKCHACRTFEDLVKRADSHPWTHGGSAATYTGR
jgi:hypothetical protein